MEIFSLGEALETHLLRSEMEKSMAWGKDARKVNASGQPRPSVYRYLLSGREKWFLSKGDWLVLLVGAIVTSWGGIVLGRMGTKGQGVLESPGSMSTLWGFLLVEGFLVAGAASTAGLVARWMGRKIGLWAGWIDGWLGGLLVGLVCCWSPGLWGGQRLALYTLLGRWVVGSFALVHLHGVIAPCQWGIIRWAFWGAWAGCWLLGGWWGGVVPGLICLLVLAWLEDAQGLRFFVFPAGWIVLGGVLIVAELAGGFGLPEGNIWIDFGLSTGQQTSIGALLAALARQSVGMLGAILATTGMAGAWFSVRQGGLRSPGGSLFSAWALVAGLAVLLEILLRILRVGPVLASGAFPERVALLIGMFLPAWAAAASVGGNRFGWWCRRVSG